jgi:hypothetical protein
LRDGDGLEHGLGDLRCLPGELAVGRCEAERRLIGESDPYEAVLAGPLYQQLAALKGMTSPGAPPPIQIKSRDETRRFIQQEMDRRYSAARIESERKGMVAWGLIPPTYDLRRLFVDLMEEQIAAYYDPVSKVMVVGLAAPDQHKPPSCTSSCMRCRNGGSRPMCSIRLIPPRRQLLARAAP